ncbi:2Fe-2S iron-sulfur cluster-binding protein [Pseudalkalibacillus berkeleyi]|uniref:(2Fe-2S)-binding protein n=1 Tax=Pseudalkalibacillus berkeleyi TaxID=1069813 RepID=A0ABS9GX28_9BACL|nr:2Fe-2S iron-sulfur cluster-binding protein [Pseudalkalibacillus berkeleyi]MCF6137244.1 (2Fe-2S)-binding protein [Pseudalkalibacillus berkeleyi]
MSKQLTIGSLKKNILDMKRQQHNEIEDTSVNENQSILNGRQESDHSSKIFVKQKSVVCAVQPMNEMTLLDSALEQSCHLEHKCKKGTCGKCTVRILKGQSVLSNPNDLENEKLGSQLGDGYRLACQALFKA